MTTSSEVTWQPARKVTIVESIVDQFAQQIQAGQLNPGDRLPSERQLIGMLDAGRSSVREALQGLAVMGLIDIRPGQGAFVSATARARLLPDIRNSRLTDHLERDMRLQLVEARRTLEPPVTRLAAQRGSAEQIAVLYRRFADYRAEPFGRAADSRMSGPHGALHLHLAEMSGNPFFVYVVETLLRAVPETLRQRERLAMEEAALRQLICDEISMHDAIVKAVEQHDGEAAFEAMDVHLAYEWRLVKRLFP